MHCIHTSGLHLNATYVFYLKQLLFLRNYSFIHFDVITQIPHPSYKLTTNYSLKYLYKRHVKVIIGILS